jgi:hypothetical protein
MVFARKIMKRPNSSLFLGSKDEQGSMLDLRGLPNLKDKLLGPSS